MFTVTIPLVTADAPPGRSDEPAVSTIGPDREGRPSVLLVEDDTDLREFLTRLLTGDGWTVRSCGDAETALELAGGSSGPAPDLVITDVVLPGRDGLTLIGQLRRQPATQRSPMIVLTARHGADAAAQGLAAGADDYITKPFSADELLARVRAHHELAGLRETAVSTAQAKADQLRAGLDSNRVIGTATGILMATHRLPAAAAFRLLVAASQHGNRKVRDVAADVTTTHRLPLRPTLTDELLIRVTGTRDDPARHPGIPPATDTGAAGRVASGPAD
jgi:DNA-binding response OmpR family regulator